MVEVEGVSEGAQRAAAGLLRRVGGQACVRLTAEVHMPAQRLNPKGARDRAMAEILWSSLFSGRQIGAGRCSGSFNLPVSVQSRTNLSRSLAEAQLSVRLVFPFCTFAAQCARLDCLPQAVTLL
jgi:hypothetical protein